MSVHFEDVPCPCPWCRLAGQQDSLHRVRRMLVDDKPLSDEAKAILDEIVRDALAKLTV